MKQKTVGTYQIDDDQLKDVVGGSKTRIGKMFYFYANSKYFDGSYIYVVQEEKLGVLNNEDIPVTKYTAVNKQISGNGTSTTKKAEVLDGYEKLEG